MDQEKEEELLKSDTETENENKAEQGGKKAEDNTEENMKQT